MTNKHREYIYKNKNKFEINYKIDEELPFYEVNFSKSYNWNKKQLEKVFDKRRQAGIWVIEDSEEHIKRNSKKEYYEIAQTSDIKLESLKALQWLFLGKRDAKKNIYNRYSRKVYTRYKYQQIYLSSSRKTKRNHNVSLIFRQIILDSNKESRLDKEMSFAINNEAKYWSPDHIQTKKIWDILGKENM